MQTHAKAIIVGFALLLGVLPSSTSGESLVEEARKTEGQTLFIKHKCNMCHAVPAAGIEAKTKSEKMKGSELGGPVEGEPTSIADYLRKKGKLDGKTHKKEFKGTDEELQGILDWLAGLTLKDDAPESD